MPLRSALFVVSVLLVVSACEREAVAPADAGSGIELAAVTDHQGGQIFLEIYPFADARSGLAVALGSADAFPICG